MKAIFFIMAAAIISCTNSPEGSTNTEGSGASILPEKTGDTSRDSTDNGSNRGLISTDSIMNAPGKPKDSGTVLTETDSALIKVQMKSHGQDSAATKRSKKKPGTGH